MAFREEWSFVKGSSGPSTSEVMDWHRIGDKQLPESIVTEVFNFSAIKAAPGRWKPHLAGEMHADVFDSLWRHHDNVIKWKHFPRYWPSVRGIHRSPVNSPHKGQWRGALMFSLICARINGSVNNGEAGDLRHHRAHYDVIVMTVCHSESIRTHTGSRLKSDETSYCQISQNLEAARFIFRIVRSLWNLTGTSTAALPRCLPNFQSEATDFTTKFASSRLHEILR